MTQQQRRQATMVALVLVVLVRVLLLDLAVIAAVDVTANARKASNPVEALANEFSKNFLKLKFNATTREDRFPSVEERVKVYMSNWYLPPCSSEGKVLYQFIRNGTSPPTLWIHEPRDLVYEARQYITESTIQPDKVFFVDRQKILACSNLLDESDGAKRSKHYCRDAADTLLTAWDHAIWGKQQRQQQQHDNPTTITNSSLEWPSSPSPILVQFGDLRYSVVYRFVNAPLIKKFRSATSKEEIKRVTSNATACTSDRRRRRDAVQTAHDFPSLQPIVWNLGSKRHFGMLHKVYLEDTPWEMKRDMAVFRGEMTGAADGYNPKLTQEQNCRNLRRCRLVYKHANSTWIDARLTSTRNRLPRVLNGVKLVGKPLSLQSMLEFKGVIMVEGNDVATGLKWALLSQSVVLMPPPSHMSWAMEELLEPWVHYIPLKDDFSDVEAMMQWVVQNDKHARLIAERGSLWMQDLVFHPDAKEDDRLVQEEILRRYMAHFQQVE